MRQTKFVKSLYQTNIITEIFLLRSEMKALINTVAIYKLLSFLPQLS